jgi:hypothetical protein
MGAVLTSGEYRSTGLVFQERFAVPLHFNSAETLAVLKFRAHGFVHILAKHPPLPFPTASPCAHVEADPKRSHSHKENT